MSRSRSKVDPDYVKVLVERYVASQIRCEEVRDWLSKNYDRHQQPALHARASREFMSNPKYPGQPNGKDKESMAEFWRKCDAIFNAKPANALEQMLLFFTSFWAMQCISSIELGGSLEVSAALAAAQPRVAEILYARNLVPSEELFGMEETPSSDAHLLSWLGKDLTIRRNGALVNYKVLDAGSSAMKGSYYLLEDMAGATREIPVEEFERMVEQRVRG